MANIPARQDWIFGENKCDFSKDYLKQMYVLRFLNKTQQIFKYNGLPDTIPAKDLELILQVNGNAIIKEVEGKLYAFRGGLGGEPNPYYLPTKAIVSNPALKYNATLDIDEDCVVMLNDAMYQGLMPLINTNAYLLAECDITLKFATINSRIPALIDCPDDETKEEALTFLKKIEDGNFGVLCDEAFGKNLNVYDYAKTMNITSILELKQYIIGTFYQELGVQSQFNMKREAINEAEAVLSENALYPSLDEMLLQRQIGLEKVNKMYGTNITVEFNSAWATLRERQEISIEQARSEIVEPENDTETKQDGEDNENE